MHDNWLIALALAVASLGITLLLFALIFLESPFGTVHDARIAADGEPLRLKGRVLDVQQRGNLTIIRLSQEATIDITVFENVTLGGGECVIASGKRSSYKGAAQLVATRITRC